MFLSSVCSTVAPCPASDRCLKVFTLLNTFVKPKICLFGEFLLVLLCLSCDEFDGIFFTETGAAHWWFYQTFQDTCYSHAYFHTDIFKWSITCFRSQLPAASFLATCYSQICCRSQGVKKGRIQYLETVFAPHSCLSKECIGSRKRLILRWNKFSTNCHCAKDEECKQ